MPCPSQADLANYFERIGGGITDDRNRLSSHVSTCESCKRKLASLSRSPDNPLSHPARGSGSVIVSDDDDTLPETARTTERRKADRLGSSSARIAAGDRIGRLEVGKILGEGAFGVVFAAFDPDLSRNVAVKVLRTEVYASEAADEARERLLREARAMAQISHPNVVGVHDIGTVNGQVFVAMEFIQGQTLREWVAVNSPEVSAITKLFIGAANGLAAAHARGLVHRDFKPENVLVDRGGVARVADFGLVTVAANPRDTPAVDPSNSTVALPTLGESGDVMLTNAGTVIGTAVYMSPEQHQQAAVGPASDQFSFCVAFYEALYGFRPFAGQTLRVLRENVLAQNILPAPAGASVPGRVHRAIVRGLSAEPTARFESMNELSRQLRPPRRRQRAVQLALAATVAAAVGGGLAWNFARTGSSPCEDAGTTASSLWSSERRAQLSEVFSSKGRAANFQRFSLAIDGYTKNWAAMAKQSCAATHVRREQSGELLDKRTACLASQLGYVRELLAVLGPNAEPVTIDEATVAAARLPELAECSNLERLGGLAPLPTDPETRVQVVEFQKRLSEAKALSNVGSTKAAHRLLTAALDSPPDAPQTLARAHRSLAVLEIELGDLEKAEQRLTLAVEHAANAGDDILTGQSWQVLMELEGIERNNHERAHELANIARLAYVRGKARASLFADLKTSVAEVHRREGNLAKGLAILKELEQEMTESATPLQLAGFLLTYGNARQQNGEYAEAIKLYEHGLEVLDTTLGPVHPRVMSMLNNVAIARKNSGDLEGAHKDLQRSVAITEEIFGAEHRDLITVLANLGNIERKLGRNDDAKKTLERAIAIGAKEPDQHVEVPAVLTNLAIVYFAEKNYDEATKRFRDVLEANKALHKPGHPRIATSIHNVGEVLLAADKNDEAVEMLLRAKEAKAKAFGTDHPTYASTLFALGSAADKLGNGQEALAYYGEALRIFEKLGDKHPRALACLRALGLSHESSGSAQKAIEFLGRALAVRAKANKADKTNKGAKGGIEMDEATEQFALIRATWRLGQRARSTELAETLSSRLERAKPASGSGLAVVVTALKTWRATKR